MGAPENLSSCFSCSLMGTIVKGQSRAILPIRLPRRFASSVHRRLSAGVARPQSKPVLPSSYPQSAAFAAPALYSPSSEVQSLWRSSLQNRSRTHLGRDILASLSRALRRMTSLCFASPEILSFGYATFLSFRDAFCIARYSISAR